jgi:Putative amidoligase enzyme/Protein of unknown function (DUF3489)
MANFERTFGVEIECMAPSGTRAQLARMITDLGIHCEAPAYGHNVPSCWKIITDGSLSDYTRGFEIVSPPLNVVTGFEQIDKICALLEQKNFTVNRSCGLHVHIDTRRPTALDIAALKRLAMLYVEHESIIDMVLPSSRRGRANNYLNSIAQVSLAEIQRCEDTTQLARVLRGQSRAYNSGSRFASTGHSLRYVKLNFAAGWRYGTVEFRHHSGTIDATKIKNWVLACQRMVDLAAKSDDGAVMAETRRIIRAARARAGTKQKIVYDMLLRREGCTQLEVCEATGWQMVSVVGIAHSFGMTVRRMRENRRYRYFGYNPGGHEFYTPEKPRQGKSGRPGKNRPTGQARPQRATNFEEFAERLGMDENEKQFWLERARLFRGRNQPAE